MYPPDCRPTDKARFSIVYYQICASLENAGPCLCSSPAYAAVDRCSRRCGVLFTDTNFLLPFEALKILDRHDRAGFHKYEVSTLNKCSQHVIAAVTFQRPAGATNSMHSSAPDAGRLPYGTCRLSGTHPAQSSFYQSWPRRVGSAPGAMIVKTYQRVDQSVDAPHSARAFVYWLLTLDFSRQLLGEKMAFRCMPWSTISINRTETRCDSNYAHVRAASWSLALLWGSLAQRR
jgi:hypothetical protein